LKLVVTLLCVCVVCSTVLALVNQLTAEEIARQEALKEQELRAEVLAGSGNDVQFDEPVTIDGREYFAGRLADGSPAGTVFAAEAEKGYAGKIRLIIGVAADGKSVAGVRVLKHGETPGLGARIVETRPGESEPWFLAQFKGLSAQQLFVKQDAPAGAIDAITAATISSRAVTDCVREEVGQFAKSVWPQLKEKAEQRDTGT